MAAGMVSENSDCYTHGCEVINLRKENIKLKVHIMILKTEVIYYLIEVKKILYQKFRLSRLLVMGRG